MLTPMLGEIYCSIALAKEAGVSDRLRCVVGVAEEIPFADNTFDGVYSGGCVHHMTTELAMPEIARVLKSGGRFSASIRGERRCTRSAPRFWASARSNVFCRPLTRKRASHRCSRASAKAKKVQYGALTRYPVLALWKFGINVPFSMMWQLYRFDDAVCSCIPGHAEIGQQRGTVWDEEVDA